jgi:hypothetical protein
MAVVKGGGGFMLTRLLYGTLVVMLLAGGAMATANKGAEQISLDGGSRGNISFPHHLHQNALNNCQVCHTLFPQEKGSIDRLKQQGKLQNKQVMNTLCIQCHKARKKMGKCHVKN